jgi:hypothetical protein
VGQFQSGIIICGADVVGTSTGTTAIITLANGFIVSQIQMVSTTISGGITGPTFSIGTNASSYNNIATSALSTLFTTNNAVLVVSLANPTVHVNSGDTININVTIAAVATTYNFQIILHGYPL